MTRLRLAFTLMGVCSLALGSVGPASAGARAQSKYGGTLVVAEAGSLTTGLDPTLPGARRAQEVIRTFCQGLYDVGAKGHVVPLLASAMPTISKDKRTYTIPIRKGILFNDGTPFNAQAVVTTLERDMTLPGSFRAPDLALIDTVAAPDPSTVVIHLKAPFTPLTDLLAAEAGEVMSPTQLAKLGDDFGQNPVCVGPFMFDSQVAGSSITVVKSPYYYDKYSVFLDKIVFKSISDAAAATAALRAGDVQAIDSVSTTQLPSISSDPGMTVLHQNTLGYNALFINIGNTNGQPPYSNRDTPLASNPNVRKAFEEAIDRDTLNRVLFDGRMQPGCTPLAPASPWYDDSIPCTPYNPKDARKLLARARYPSLTVHLLIGSATDNLRIAQFVQAQEAAVGINVVIDALDGGAVQARLEAGNFDVFLGGSPGELDPDTLISARNATSGTVNQSGYSNPRLDLILDNGRKALTEKARRTLYHAAEMIIANDRPAVYLYHPVLFSAFNAALTGVQLRLDGILRVAFAQYK